MKRAAFFLALVVPSVAFAGDWKSFNKKKYDSLTKAYYASVYDTRSLYVSGDYVTVWARKLAASGKPIDEYLTEFNCKANRYRQLGLRVFVASAPVPGDAIYKQWFDVPDATQDLGMLFRAVCTEVTR